MLVYINNKPSNLPDEITNIVQLLDFLNIKRGGTAVAVNNKLIINSKWDQIRLKEKDNVTIISAAFGG